MLKNQKLNFELFLVSFLILFTEIALIRWISTEVRIFAYFNNLVLLACFLGIGLGCYWSKKKVSLAVSATSLSIILVLINLPFYAKYGSEYLHVFRDIPLLLSVFEDSLIWYGYASSSILLSAIQGILSTLVIFLLTLLIFIPLGQILGTHFESHENSILAYSINIIASLLGVWVFSGMSFIHTQPTLWFGFITILIFLLIVVSKRKSFIDFVTILLLFLLTQSTIPMPSDLHKQGMILWSAYQKLEIKSSHLRGSPESDFRVAVNNVRFMSLIDLSDEFISRYPDRFSKGERKFSQYDIPYLFKENPKNVLLLGAGAGNDAAGSVRNNPEHVDAVEIDSGIINMGRKYHPEKPYSAPHVNVVIDDARSFLKKTKKKYDVISFGLLDAHVSVSSFNNMRLDHYVYTKESFAETKKLLSDDGVLTVIFRASKPWINARIFNILKEVFGHSPVAYYVDTGLLYGGGGSMFITGRNIEKIHESLKRNLILNQYISNNQFKSSWLDPNVKITTDNWPYFYLEKPMIPKMHLCIIFILILMLLLSKKVMIPNKQRIDFHFFFLGAAFLLLEFTNISKSSLLFGSTWLVNSLVITAILILILFANIFVLRKKNICLKKIYFMLVISIIINFAVPLDFYNNLTFSQKLVAGNLILNLPIFFAGIIFVNSFNKAMNKSISFGSNIIGAFVGGLFESLSFIFGINVLLIFVVIFYISSFVCLKE